MRPHSGTHRKKKPPPIGQATKGATQKAEHLAGQRLEHDDSSQPRSISECCGNYWNNHLRVGNSQTTRLSASVSRQLTDDFPSPMFNCITQFCWDPGSSIFVAISA